MTINNFEKIKIIDNYLPETTMLQLENFILSSNFPYYYTENIAGEDFKKTNTFMFFHNLILEGEEYSNVGHLITNIIMDKIPYKNILRSKINFYLKTDRIQLHDFHVDNSHQQVKVAIFYINTNNGVTEFENNTIVNSIRNRLVLFPGELKHRSTNTTDKKNRVNININYS